MYHNKKININNYKFGDVNVNNGLARKKKRADVTPSHKIKLDIKEMKLNKKIKLWNEKNK